MRASRTKHNTLACLYYLFKSWPDHDGPGGRGHVKCRVLLRVGRSDDGHHVVSIRLVYLGFAESEVSYNTSVSMPSKSIFITGTYAASTALKSLSHGSSSTSKRPAS
ncbi:unnamed protein product [Spodoptera littoralis]|uniref:Uncharacterized protein n=1 Tax=Spodoptera littoralis TaxID=7109 RepID=A0A9P0I9B4_SPOLI|nr:unnamed protein product [Spodoptera littoralis]CAH1642432.1 unnamed protein product [Spodoptera littoralis]